MQLPALLERIRAAHGLPGLAAAVIAGGRRELVAGFGTRNFQGDPVTPRTRFPLASATKTFTGALVAGLVRRRRLDWTAPLLDLLPDFRLMEDRGAGLTLNDAVTHRGPLPPHTWAWVFSGMERSAWVRERLPHLAVVPNPGHAHRYSNILYAVLGEVIGHLEGSPWETVLAGRILHPMGLRDTQLLDLNWPSVPDTASPFEPGPDGPVPVPPFHARAGHLIAPASELSSTAADSARWLLACLADPGFAPPGLIPCPIPASSGRSGHAGPLHYACGWRVETLHGLVHAFHTGQCTGYTTLYSMIPARGIAVALLCNAGGVVEVLLRALHQVLGRLLEKPVDAPDVPAAAKTPPRLALRPVSASALPRGRFSHPGYGELQFISDAGGVRVLFQGHDLLVGTDDAGRTHLEIPGYGARFPILLGPGRVNIPFEPAVEPVCFSI